MVMAICKYVSKERRATVVLSILIAVSFSLIKSMEQPDPEIIEYFESAIQDQERQLTTTIPSIDQFNYIVGLVNEYRQLLRKKPGEELRYNWLEGICLCGKALLELEKRVRANRLATDDTFDYLRRIIEVDILNYRQSTQNPNAFRELENEIRTLIIPAEQPIAFPHISLETQQMIENLKQHWGVLSPEDCRPTYRVEHAEPVIGNPVTELVCVMAGYKPISSSQMQLMKTFFKQYPNLLNCLKKEDCPVKVLVIEHFTPDPLTNFQQVSFIAYDASREGAQHNVYAYVKFRLQTELDKFAQNDYLYGLFYGYPEKDIRAYYVSTGRGFEVDKQMALAWLKQNRHKTIDELINEIHALQRESYELIIKNFDKVKENPPTFIPKVQLKEYLEYVQKVISIPPSPFGSKDWREYL